MYINATIRQFVQTLFPRSSDSTAELCLRSLSTESRKDAVSPLWLELEMLANTPRSARTGADTGGGGKLPTRTFSLSVMFAGGEESCCTKTSS